MRKRKLLSLLVLLMTAVTGAWAQRLYLEVNGTAATLKYSANEADYSDKPYFNGTSWQNASGFKASVKTITVDASCENFAGDKLDGLFSGCSELTSITGLGTINTTNVTIMSNMFQNCSGLGTLDLSGLNTEEVTKMRNMFYGCSGLTTLTFGSSFNTAKVTDMSYMFYYCSGLGTLDLSSFNTSSVTDMSYMFRGCAGLQTLDISSFNTGNVTKMGSMFYGCSQLTAIFVGAGAGWSVASSATSMFTNCTNLPNWDGTSNGTHANTGDDGYLNKVKVTANEGETGEFWATYYNEYKHLIAPTGTQVFKVALSGTTLAMNEITDRILTKGKGVVLKGTSNSIILDVNATASEDNYTGNSLQGTMTSITNPGNAYVLNKKTAGVGFYKLSSGGTVGANKAYLTYDGALARDFFLFGDDNMTTGIASMHNAQCIMHNDVFDLQGRRVVNPTKGLYIVNGKKVFINK